MCGVDVQKEGSVYGEAAGVEEETLMEIALEAGAEDVELDNDTFEITCSVEAYEAVKKTLQEKEVRLGTITSAE